MVEFLSNVSNAQGLVSLSPQKRANDRGEEKKKAEEILTPVGIKRIERKRSSISIAQYFGWPGQLFPGILLTVVMDPLAAYQSVTLHCFLLLQRSK